jgi:hypothetical protein
MKRIFIVLVLFVFFTNPTLAEDGIFVAGSTIKLGDNKNVVLSNLQNNSSISKFGHLDTYNIIVSDGRDIGHVSFENNKVTQVYKKWGFFQITEGRNILRALIGAISTIPEDPEGKRFASVSTQRQINPDNTVELVSLSFGKRMIWILLIDYKGTPHFQVDEYLSE